MPSSAASDSVIQNLRAQVRELETFLIRTSAQLALFETAAIERLGAVERAAEQIRQLQAERDAFEAAAAERLRVIEESAQLVADRDQQIAALRTQLEQHQDFETIATERLGVIDHGAQLLRERDAAIAALQQQLAALHRQLDDARSQSAAFETAATERLTVIERGKQLLQASQDAIGAIQQQHALQIDSWNSERAALRSDLAQAQDESTRLRDANAELTRGLVELAARERDQTRQILELHQEGLVNSIIRRARSLFS